MRLRLLYLTLLLFYFSNASAQVVPDSTILMTGDAVDSLVTDTSIIYVIKRAPIQIKQRIEIERERKKINRALQLSIAFGLIGYSEKSKAKPSYEEYLTHVNNSLNNQVSYSFAITLWRCPQKIYTGIDAHFYKLRQNFSYDGYSSTNRFSYAGLGFFGGYSLVKNKKLMLIPYIGFLGENSSSNSGFTLTSSYTPTRINGVIRYRPYMINVSVGMKTVVILKNTLLEIDPYLYIPIMSATTKQNNYSLYRIIFGVRIGFVNKFF